ncbi:MAG: hypothetical protein V3S01_00630, partial [Dehalococcoidia bacterium]
WTDGGPVGGHGEKTREDALVFAQASIEDGCFRVLVEEIKQWKTVTTPGAWFDQIREEPVILLEVSPRKDDDDKRPYATGPWAPDKWAVLFATDTVIFETLAAEPKSVKAIGEAVVKAGHEALKPAVIRRHLKRLRFKVVGQTQKGQKDTDGKKIRSVPLWGRKS